MFRNRPMLLFILILALGLFIEGLKSYSEIKGPKDSKIGAGIGSLDLTPFRVSDNMMKQERAKLIREQLAQRKAGFRLAGGPKLKEQYDLSEGHKVAEKSKVAQAETKDKKKKKKKKKDDKGRGKGDIAKVKTDVYEEKKTGFGATAAEEMQHTQTYVQPTDPKKDNKIPISYEEWALLILGQPRPDNVSKLISYFKSNMVSGEVFYAITAAMLQESNEKQHDLAMYAVGQIHSPRSVEFLIEVLKGESQGSSIASKASSALNDYIATTNVRSLMAVLSAHSTEVPYMQVVLNLLDTSTRNNIENRENREPTAEETANPELTAQRRARLANIYSGFIPYLETILTNYSGRSEITDPAQASLTRIRAVTAVVVADNL